MEDWGQLISFDPGVVLRPTSIDELKDVLERVHRGELANGRVRVPGSLHSCSEIVVSDALLDTSALPKTIDFEADDAAVVATANVSLHDFLAEAGRRGKSVTATGGVDHQTLAGLISTGTAPASSRHGLYELLEWVELITVDATSGQAVERRIARGDPGFAAAVCSLGLLGVLTRVRFRLVDELYFDTVLKVVHLDDVLADLDATSAKYDFWRVNWVPKSEKALLWAATAVPRGESAPDGDYDADQAEHVLDTVFGVLDKLTDSGPLLTKPLELVYDVMALTYKPSHATGPLRNMLPVDRRAPLRVAMAEWSFRPQDVHRVIGECEDYFGRHGWPNIPTEIELSRVDGSLMSAWNWDGLPYIVKFNWMYLTEVCTKPGEKEAIYAHLRGLWEHLEAAGVPFKAHWGKINFIDPEFVRRNHGIDAFRPLIAPIFMNDYLAERIGPVGMNDGDAFPGLTDIHAHPAMNSFLWGRNLNRHYWSGHHFNPLASTTDFKMLKKGGVKVLWSSLHIPEPQFFDCWYIRLASHFFSGGRTLRKKDAWECLLRMMANMEQQVAGTDRFDMAKSNDELDVVLGKGGAAIVHTVEGGHVLSADLAPDDVPARIERLEELAARGVASLTLAHLFPNDLAGHAEAIPEKQRTSRVCPKKTEVDLTRGLSLAGRAVVERMVTLPMVPDVSHCTPVARQEIYGIVANRIPVVATHVGLQSMNPVKYNLDETDVRAIAASGGVVGVIFMPHWLDKADPGPGLDAIWRTMDGIRGLTGGWEHVAIGTDFDGFTDPPDDCHNASKLPVIREMLMGNGLMRSEADAVLGGNARRVLRNGWR